LLRIKGNPTKFLVSTRKWEGSFTTIKNVFNKRKGKIVEN